MADYNGQASNADIDKIAGLQSNASEIDGLYGSTMDKLFKTAKSGLNNQVLYIVAGDSTRDNSFNEMIAYYTTQLAKINIAVFNNSESGQDADEWLRNITYSNASLQDAIDASTGLDGKDTILEFSYGINDWDGIRTEAQVKVRIKDAIEAYILAKPAAKVFLVIPVFTGNSSRNIGLPKIYNELSVELGLPIVDGLLATKAVHGNPTFYTDSTHPNKYGSRRLTNYILAHIVPSDVISKLTLTPNDVLNVPTADTEFFDGTTESGYYSSSDGLPAVASTWLRIANPIAVEPNFVLNVEHYGNRTDIHFYDVNDNFITTGTLAVVDGEVYKQVTIPLGVYFVRLHITSDVASYSNTTISIRYDINPVSAPTLKQEHEGLSLPYNLPITDPDNVTLQPNSVTMREASFFSQSKNVLDKAFLTIGSYMGSGGYPTVSATYDYSELIMVNPYEEYVVSPRVRFVVFYDKDKVAFNDTALSLPTSFIVPATAAYMVVSIYHSDIDSVQVELGTVATAYEASGYDIILPNGNKIRL